MKPVKPHVSEALRHLRAGITFAAIVVGVCAVMQLLVFGFVHFTEVRWEKAAPAPTTQHPTVVAAENRPVTGVPSASTGKAPSVLQAGDPATKPASKELATVKPATITVPGAPRPGLVYSRWHGALGFYSDAAVTVGIMATLLLAILAFQGVIVGAHVPGVEKSVSASTWSLVLMLLALPWREFLPKVPFAGIFGSYESMTKASAATQLGQIPSVALMAEFLLLPLMALVSAMLILIRFRGGVERGFIITSVNELDAALTREMRDMAKRGPGQTGMARTVGALNQAIGERPSDPIMDNLLAPPKAGTSHPAEPDVSRTRSWVSPSERSDADNDPRRPI